MPIFTGYHASNYLNIKEFDMNKRSGQDFGPGFYFASTKEGAEPFGQIVYEAKIELNNPLLVNNTEESKAAAKKFGRAFRVTDEDLQFGVGHPFEEIMALIQHVYSLNTIYKVLKKLGYDGIIVDSEIVKAHGGENCDYIIALDPSNIKDLVKVSNSYEKLANLFLKLSRA